MTLEQDKKRKKGSRKRKKKRCPTCGIIKATKAAKRCPSCRRKIS